MKCFLYFTIILSILNAKIIIEKNSTYNILEEPINKSIELIKINNNLINEVFSDYSIDKKLAISIIFPELVRYSHLKNYFELKTNEILYIKFGASYSDFSIGFSQMKPSFAKRIEDELKIKPSIKKYQHKFDYNKKITKNLIRKERLNRLNDFSWQLQYLAVFIKIIDSYTNKNYYKNILEKIEYYANAYNSGIWNNNILNKKLSLNKNFPYGKLPYGTNSFTYSEISILYYKILMLK